jgi:heat shock protein HslJ
MTLMDCEEPDGVMPQEQSYLAALGSADAYRIAGDQLSISDAAGSALLIFEREGAIAMNPAELVGSAWQLDSVDGKHADGHYTLVFDSATRLSGRTACRDYRADYQADSDSFGLGFMEMVGLDCLRPRVVLPAEGDYTTRLGWVNRYRLDGDKLELLTTRGESLVFVPLASDAQAGQDVVWYLVGFLQGSEALPLLPGTEITLNAGRGVLDASGSLGGSAGCNTYQAPYTFRDSQFVIGAVVTTRMACLEPAGIMEQEVRYVSWLQAVTTFGFDADQLRLESADGRVLLFSMAPAAPAEPNGAQSPPWVVPPPATLTIGGRTQTGGLGSYCWGSGGYSSSGPGMCADTMGIITPRQVLAAPEAGFTAHLELGLEAAPAELLLRIMPAETTDVIEGDTWRAWRPDEADDYRLPLEQNPAIELRLEPGLYVFHIFVIWQGYGDVSYGFLVQVG